MSNLLENIEKLKISPLKNIIDHKISDFENIERNQIFNELCFCILTANFDAKRAIKIQANINFETETLLADRLREFGHRSPNIRAKYILEARSKKELIITTISAESNSHKLREWLVKNIRGLGYKEASHFLRNIGLKDLAIIDFHILDLLEKHQIIQKPKYLNKGNYLLIENKLQKLGNRVNLNLAELDLYLWYIETKKVLK